MITDHLRELSDWDFEKFNPTKYESDIILSYVDNISVYLVQSTNVLFPRFFR